MQSQLAHPSAHDQEPDPQISVHHPEDEEHEKKSTKVLKKVKEKAKKIKNTLTGHGHGHEHEHIPDDHDLYEEDDEDDETVVDPEVHGAPMYESAAVRSGYTGQPESLSHPGKSLSPVAEEVVPPGTKVFPVESSFPERPSEPIRRSRQEDNQTPQNTPVSFVPTEHLTGDTNVSATEPERTFVPGTGQRKVNIGKPRGLEEDPAGPNGGSGGRNTASNYQSKVNDPTGKGGEEVNVDSMIHDLGKMKVSSKEEINPRTEQKIPGAKEESFTQFSTGSHNQFSPEPTPPKPVSAVTTENQPMEVDEDQPKQMTYTEKISSTTSAIADKAVAAKNAVASKLGYGGKDENAGGHETRSGEQSKSLASSVTDKLTPVYEKVKETGTTVLSKMPLSGTTGEAGRTGGNNSMKGYIAEKLRPGEEDKALSEVIAERLQRGVVDGKKGKVTESVEVERRLGGFGEESSKEEVKIGSSFAGETQMGVVDKFKGAVTSWLGGQPDVPNQDSSQSLGSTQGTEGFAGSVENIGSETGGAGDRKLQGSGN